MGRTGVRIGALMVATCLAMAACGAPTTEPMSQVRPMDGGVAVTVPALWADVSQGIGGVEPAGVWAGTLGPPGFDIDLTSIEANGAGPAWQAASASAAAVASMYSGLDPAEIDIHFTVSGPIDGPSAGGILTVGVLAALRGASLVPGVTMTGSISPDGSIGRVGGIALKLESAKEAGYSTVLLPPSNHYFVDKDTGERRNAREIGAELGLTVKFVADAAAAYREFTGRELVSSGATKFELSTDVQAAGATTARNLVERLKARSTTLDGPEGQDVASQIDDAYMALAAGDPALAYGLGVDALYRSSRAEAEHATSKQIKLQGIPSAVSALRSEARRVRERAEQALARGSAKEMSSYEQQMVLPSALTWLAYPIAALDALVPSLVESMPERDVLTASRTIALMSASVDILGPDAQAVVYAMPGQPPLQKGAMATFLSSYTNFLVRAGQANRAYLEYVLLRGQSTGEAEQTTALDSELRVLVRLDAMSTAIPVGENSLAEEVSQSAIALTYYVTSAEVVSSMQAFEAPDLGIGKESPNVGNADALATSVATAHGLVVGIADYLAGQGLDAGYPSWSGQWGLAAYLALGDAERITAGAGLALDELWYASLAELMVNAGWPRG